MSNHNQRLKGREVMLFMGSSHATTQAVGCSTSCELEISCDAIEVSSPTSGQARDYIAGRTGWRMSLDKLLILPDFYDGINVGTKLTVQFAYSINSKEGIPPDQRFAAHYYEGTALITRWVCSAKNGDYVRPAKGDRYSVEIIDTWNMTIRQVDTVYELSDQNDYRYYDKDLKKVWLPLQPYLLLRIKKI